MEKTKQQLIALAQLNAQSTDKKKIRAYCKRRAEKAKKLLSAYDPEDLQASIGDCLADLLHLCAQNKIDFWDCLDNGQMHFSAEKLGGEL